MSRAVVASIFANLPEGPVTLHWGVVHATHTGPPKSLDVFIDGSATATPSVRYSAGYTPTIGDFVAVLQTSTQSGSDHYVLGPPA
jgi:hypothetical protein